MQKEEVFSETSRDFDNWREATENEAQEYGAHYMVRDFPGGSW